jgi:hypothetical protein
MSAYLQQAHVPAYLWLLNMPNQPTFARDFTGYEVEVVAIVEEALVAECVLVSFVSPHFSKLRAAEREVGRRGVGGWSGDPLQEPNLASDLRDSRHILSHDYMTEWTGKEI